MWTSNRGYGRGPGIPRNAGVPDEAPLRKLPTQPEIDRRQRIAQSLMSSNQPQGQWAGRFYVAPSPFEHAAGAAQRLAGAWMGRNASDNQAALDNSSRVALASTLAGLQEPSGHGSQPLPPELSAIQSLPIEQQRQAIGRIATDRYIRSQQPAPRDPLVQTVGENGRPILTPQSEAAGLEPYTGRNNLPGSGPSIGNVTPGDYTPASLDSFAASGDYGDLVRYESVKQVDLGGGRKGLLDYRTGTVTEVVGKADFDNNVRDSSAAKSEGAALGKERSEAQLQLDEMDTLAQQLDRMMGSEDFDAAVGPIDAVTGRIGEAFGSRQGVLGGEVQRLANRLVTLAAASWKGAISETELQFFLDSVPGRSSSPETWRHWYKNEFLPRHQLAKRRVSGGVSSSTTPDQGEDIQSLIDYYANGGAQ